MFVFGHLVRVRRHGERRRPATGRAREGRVAQAGGSAPGDGLAPEASGGAVVAGGGVVAAGGVAVAAGTLAAAAVELEMLEAERLPPLGPLPVPDP
jgi:hypothetical protein